MSTPQETPPAGKHHAPQAGNGRSGVPLVRLINAGKRYGAVIALHDINLEVGAMRSPACWVTTGPASPP
jgi:hypothetical protein